MGRSDMRYGVFIFIGCCLFLSISPVLAQCGGGGGGGSVRVGSGRGGAPIGEEAESRRIHRERLSNLGGDILEGRFALRPAVQPLVPKQKTLLQRMSEKLPQGTPERERLIELAGRLSSGHFKALAIFLDQKYAGEQQESFAPKESPF